MKKIILKDNEKIVAENGYITQNGDVDDRFFAKEIYAKYLDVYNYRETTEAEKIDYENSLNANTI